MESKSGRGMRGTVPKTRIVGVRPSGPAVLFTTWTESDKRICLFWDGSSSFSFCYTRLMREWYRSHSESELCDWVGVSFETMPSLRTCHLEIFGCELRTLIVRYNVGVSGKDCNPKFHDQIPGVFRGFGLHKLATEYRDTSINDMQDGASVNPH